MQAKKEEFLYIGTETDRGSKTLGPDYDSAWQVQKLMRSSSKN